MPEAIFDGFCQIFSDEKKELDPFEQSPLTRPKEEASKNKIEIN